MLYVHTCVTFFEKQWVLPESTEHFLTMVLLQQHWYDSHLTFNHNQIQQCRWEAILGIYIYMLYVT